MGEDIATPNIIKSAVLGGDRLNHPFDSLHHFFHLSFGNHLFGLLQVVIHWVDT